MPSHSFVVPARLQRPASLHALYGSTVTSNSSMQNGSSVTWCAGFSSGSPSSLPMKKLPPGISIIPAGHVRPAAAATWRSALARSVRRGRRRRGTSSPATRCRRPSPEEEHGAADGGDRGDAEPHEEAHLARARPRPPSSSRRARLRGAPAARRRRQLGSDGGGDRRRARDRLVTRTASRLADSVIAAHRVELQRLSQRAPELARRLPALRRLDGDGLREDRLDLVGHRHAEGARRRAGGRRWPTRPRAGGSRRPSSGSFPVASSTAMSASEKTSVHGPVAPCVRENCSGAP